MFTPPTKSLKLSGYSFQTFELTDFSFETGFRISYDEFHPDDSNPSTNNEVIIDRKFFSYSLSLSTLYSINKTISLGININKTSRVPTIEELIFRRSALSSLLL